MSGKALDDVYRERNLLACALTQLLNPPMAGWTPAPDEDGDEWAIVWAETPMGQVSWHVSRDVAEELAPRNDDYDYDGHSAEVKNDRLASWCEEGAWY